MQKFAVTQNDKTLLTVTATAFTDERIAKLIKLAKRDFGYNLKFYIDGVQVDTAINIVRKLLNKKGSQTYKYYLTTILKNLKACNILIAKEPYFVVQGVTITEINLNSIMTVNSLNNLFCTDEKPENAFTVFD